MASSTAKRVKQHRDNLRAAGRRPLQIGVPDTRRPGFADECRRQSKVAAVADMADTEMLDFMDEALADVDGDRRGDAPGQNGPVTDVDGLPSSP